MPPWGVKFLLAELIKIHFFRTYFLRAEMEAICTANGSPNGTEMTKMLPRCHQKSKQTSHRRLPWRFVISEDSKSVQNIINNNKIINDTCAWTPNKVSPIHDNNARCRFASGSRLLAAGRSSRATSTPGIQAVCSWSRYPGDEQVWSAGYCQLV